MIYIYKSYNNIDKLQVIEDPEAFFNGYITAQEFDSTDIDAMKAIDKAELLDKAIGTIKTPRGITSIDHLSTGCKTIIVYNYMLKHIDTKKIFLDLSYCGVNALEYIFSIAENQDKIKFILRHKDRVYECKDREYIIDGNRQITNLAYI